MYFYRVIDALENSEVEYAIVGGLAMALHGAVRGTVDIDLVIAFSKESFEAIEKTLREIGFVSRLPVIAREVFAFRAEYVKKRNLIAWSFYNPADPIQIVDVILTHNLQKMKAVKIRAGKRTIRVLSVPDLIAMKKSSNRPQDIDDIAALEKTRTK